jgi:hypothetical protein
MGLEMGQAHMLALFAGMLIKVMKMGIDLQELNLVVLFAKLN